MFGMSVPLSSVNDGELRSEPSLPSVFTLVRTLKVVFVESLCVGMGVHDQVAGLVKGAFREFGRAGLTEVFRGDR